MDPSLALPSVSTMHPLNVWLLLQLITELTALGLISLLLMAVQPSVSKMCVEPGPDRYSWTILQNVDSCDCCMAHTKGVSICAQVRLSLCQHNAARDSALGLLAVTADDLRMQIDHGCSFNYSTKAPYCSCNEHATDAEITDECRVRQGQEK